jgi:hypothetical protein
MPEISPDVNRLSWQNRDNPNLIHSNSAMRGEVLYYVETQKEVTYLQLVQQFGKAHLEEALSGLFDRGQLDFAAGKYFLDPDFAATVKALAEQRAQATLPRRPR